MNSVSGMSIGQDRMTVTNANMDILVPQVSEAMSQIALHTTASGGIVISSQLTGEEEDETENEDGRGIEGPLDEANGRCLVFVYCHDGCALDDFVAGGGRRSSTVFHWVRSGKPTLR